jgi:hypothetical protein
LHDKDLASLLCPAETDEIEGGLLTARPMWRFGSGKRDERCVPAVALNPDNAETTIFDSSGFSKNIRTATGHIHAIARPPRLLHELHAKPLYSRLDFLSRLIRVQP